MAAENNKKRKRPLQWNKNATTCSSSCSSTVTSAASVVVVLFACTSRIDSVHCFIPTTTRTTTFRLVSPSSTFEWRRARQQKVLAVIDVEDNNINNEIYDIDEWEHMTLEDKNGGSSSYKTTTASSILSGSGSPVHDKQQEQVANGSGGTSRGGGEHEDRVYLPPWLDRYSAVTEEDADSEVLWLEYSLLEHCFTAEDVGEILRTLHCVSNGDAAITTGAVDFLRLLLSLQDEPYIEKGFISKEVLVASIIHYADCIVARKQGLQSVVQAVIFGGSKSANDDENPPQNLLPPVSSMSESKNKCFEEDSSFDLPFSSSSSSQTDDMLNVGHINVEAQAIADGCARLKRAEIVAQSIRAHSDTAAWTPVEASRMINLLLSVMDDWRSLAMRCVASLYRLEGISQQLDHGSASFLDRTPEVVQTARESMRVYAILAERLGMHRLKAKIEEQAFRILYRRQHQAVSSLYREKGDAMLKLSNYLQSDISETLRQDDALVYQIEDLQVTSRVKEPFSFWKKLLKKKTEYLLEPDTSSNSGSKGDALSAVRSPSSSLTVADVQDGIALRIILRARKLTPDESDEKTRERETLLCYYVHHLIRSHWPEIEASRVKDYIEFPKNNSYQSLHHTSAINAQGIEFPFEIQIRSEQMHRIAEYGMAAHFDYKQKALAPSLAPEDSKILPPSVAEKDNAISVIDEIEPQIRIAPGCSSSYVDALVHAKQGLMTHIFVTGSAVSDQQGIIVTLPNGSRVKDAVDITAGEEDLNPKIGAKVKVWRNGNLAELNDHVENGDVVLVQ